MAGGCARGGSPAGGVSAASAIRVNPRRPRGAPPNSPSLTSRRRFGKKCLPKRRFASSPTRMETMLRIENLHAEIDGKPILKGLNLTLNAGEIHAIMGPNGAGKSTLSYVLAGRQGYEVTERSEEHTSELTSIM